MKNEQITLTNCQIEKIKNIEHFSNGIYSKLDVQLTINYYKIKFVDIIDQYYEKITEESVVLDAGCGYGWLSFALTLTTGCRVIALDADVERLEAGRQIALVLGVDDRIDWVPKPLGENSLKDKRVDIAFAIEMLEHVYRDRKAFDELGRVAKELIVLTTPNLFFPVIAHDTRLPFCHWLPIPARRVYARLMRRNEQENDNFFWSAYDIRKNLPKYKRISTIFQFPSWKVYLNTFPVYIPYRRTGYLENGPSRIKRNYYRLASLLGTKSDYFLPNLASVYRRSR